MEKAGPFVAALDLDKILSYTWASLNLRKTF